MSRKKSQRLRLFERGNKLCPLCLREFSEDEVEAGRTVTREHALAQRALGGSSRPVCLTCSSCNSAASSVENRVGRFEKFGPKVDMFLPSVGRVDVLKARLGESDSQLVLTVRAPEDPADFDVFRTVFRPGLRVESAKLTVPVPACGPRPVPQGRVSRRLLVARTFRRVLCPEPGRRTRPRADRPTRGAVDEYPRSPSRSWFVGSG